MPETRSLQEIVLAVHFAAPLSVTVREIAALATFFENDYPLFHQAPAAPRVELHAQQVGITFPMMQFDQLPRIILRSADQTRIVQFQSDRFSIGWAKTTPPHDAVDYPGYDVLRAEWAEKLNNFEQWRTATLGGSVDARLVELAYHNATPVELDGRSRRLSDIFSFVQPRGRQLMQFGMNWAEAIGDSFDSPRVQAQAGIAVMGPGIPALAYNFTGLAPVSGPINSEQSLVALDALHDRIIDMHASAIICQ